MAQPPRKRARRPTEAQDVLEGFCRTGSISNEGLQSLLKQLRQHPELLTATRNELTDGFHAKFDDVKTSIEMPLLDGGTFVWELCDPGLLLAKAYQ